MNADMILGLFAMYVATISLVQVLSGQQDALLARLRRYWGRRIGHSLYFLSHVAVPLLICVFCLGWGIRHFEPLSANDALTSKPELRLEIKSYQDLPYMFPRPQPFVASNILYGA